MKVKIIKYIAGYYMIPISLASFLGTLIFGPLFDTVGRRKMIAITCNFLKFRYWIRFAITSDILTIFT